MADNKSKLEAILKMADPQTNSSYRERQAALNKAHKLMDDTGMSYASVGMSQADAERIESQFSVAVPSKPKAQPKETRVSIFSRSGDLAVSGHPHYTPRTKTKKPVVETPDYEEENARKQREDFDRGYANWKRWRHAEDVKQAQSEAGAKKFIRNVGIAVVLLVIVGVLILLSQNAAIISAVTLAAKIFAVVFVALMAFFGLVVLR